MFDLDNDGFWTLFNNGMVYPELEHQAKTSPRLESALSESGRRQLEKLIDLAGRVLPNHTPARSRFDNDGDLDILTSITTNRLRCGATT